MQLVFVVWLVNAVFSQVSAFPTELIRSLSYYTTIISLALAILALRTGLSRSTNPAERRFWNDFSLAYAAWLVAESIYIVYNLDTTLATSLTADLGYGLYYIACVLALERKAHLPDGRDRRALDHHLRWPAVVVFVIGLHVYFVVTTAVTDHELYVTAIPSVYLYLVLDVYLAGRLLYLFRTAKPLRWKALYSLLAIAFFVSIVNDFQALALFQVSPTWWGIPALWNFMVVCFVWAVRLRRYPFPAAGGPAAGEDAAPVSESGSAPVAEPRWQTLFFALVLPLIHFAFYGAGLLDPASRQMREVVVVVWLLLIGGVALLQYRLLERSKKEVEQDRDSLSDELAWRMKAQAERERLITELEAKNAELERFTYTVSHDLKSPLVTIRGFLGFLKADVAAGKKDEAAADLQRIDAAAGRMAQLLDELLELSRIGRVVNEPQPVALGELAREAVSLVEGWIAEKGAQVEIAGDLPVVFGDRPRLLEVLQNLIENAVKFMGGEPRPRVEVGWRQDAGESVFFVRDNGIGIDPQHHEKVFGLFNRLAVDVDGTGIGLTLVKRIVEVHGGRVWIESVGPASGCTVCFTLAPAVSPASPPCVSTDGR